MMLRFLFILCIGILNGRLANAQSYRYRIDSLQKLLSGSADDTVRIRLAGELSSAYMGDGDPGKAWALAWQSLQISSQLPYNYYKALAHYRMGYVYVMQMINDSAIDQYRLAMPLLLQDSTSEKAKSLYVKCTNNLAFAYANKGYPDKAMELIISALPVIEALKDTFVYAVALHNVAAGLTGMGQYQRAYPYAQKDIRFMEMKGKPEEIAESWLSGAFLMYNMDSIQRVKEYLAKAEQSLNKVGRSFLWCRFYSYKSLYHTALKEFTLAGQACENAFSELRIYNGRTNAYDAYTARKKLLAAQGNYRQARDAAITINRMAEEDGLSSLLLSSMQDIASYSEKLGDLKEAFRYLKRYTQFKDSIDEKQEAFRLSEMEMNFQAAKKEQQIRDLQTHSKIQRSRLWGISILLGLTIIFLVYIIRQRKIRAVQKMRSLEQKQQVVVTEALLRGEEKERSRVARDLHDGLGGILAGIKLNLSRLADNEDKGIKISPMVEQLGGAVDELRRIARDMMPETLLRSGLQTALADLCESIVSAKCKVVFHAFDIRSDIPDREQIMIYRMIQEILNNAVKHSGASRIMLQCSQENTAFFITVEDDGIGFDPVQVNGNGMGLSNIRSRVDFMKGNMNIDSSEKGTIINIELHVTI